MKTAGAALAVAAAGVGWGLFESQWVRRRVLEVSVVDLPAALDGVRIAHLSDFHLGAPGLNSRAVRRGVSLALADAPDLICVTGDLRARARGDAALRRELGRLHAPLGAFAVLGNHDLGDGQDPFADGRALRDLDGTPVRLLADEAVRVPFRGHTVLVSGADPRPLMRGARLAAAADAAPAADLSVLLCHFPHVFPTLAPGRFDLVLAGHHHGGQICVPLWPGRKLRLSHRYTRYPEGPYRRAGTTMHVSRGLGTTFVPFRLAARPEVTTLVVRPARGDVAR